VERNDHEYRKAIVGQISLIPNVWSPNRKFRRTDGS
jgi:hypothetical protein